jgi:hypothetical protein
VPSAWRPRGRCRRLDFPARDRFALFAHVELHTIVHLRGGVAALTRIGHDDADLDDAQGERLRRSPSKKSGTSQCDRRAIRTSSENRYSLTKQNTFLGDGANCRRVHLHEVLDLAHHRGIWPAKLSCARIFILIRRPILDRAFPFRLSAAGFRAVPRGGVSLAMVDPGLQRLLLAACNEQSA